MNAQNLSKILVFRSEATILVPGKKWGGTFGNEEFERSDSEKYHILLLLSHVII